MGNLGARAGDFDKSEHQSERGKGKPWNAGKEDLLKSTNIRDINE